MIKIFFFNSVVCLFQDYFSSLMGQSVGGAKTGEPREKPPDTPAELGLSHMWPEWGSNPHQTQR